ncbi:PREDICTED: FAST kinase domain-containing protein 3, mitochondrial-like [Nanorana parkeri]|uniref:FAST kinase domain-containing protein 3, mitochondrial-like n=1 Tax=Nanorana parkeri TaxID=125878 RepID=UPI0008547FAD|nr:PREDICTED: FAST kinase domain-containing protein 3, mitochondrial-like [Nanorana parkeri]
MSLPFGMAVMKLIDISTHTSLMKSAYRFAVNHYTIFKHMRKKSSTLYYLRQYPSIILCPARSTTECAVCFHGERPCAFRPNNMQVDEKYFLEQLCGLSSTKQVLKLLEATSHKTDTIVAAAFLKIAENESKSGLTRNSNEVFENKVFKTILCHFEKGCQTVSTYSLVNTIKALVQLGINSHSTIMESLLPECQERINRRQMTVESLCILGESLLATEGPNFSMLQSIMDTVQDMQVDTWTPEEITVVYSLLQAGLFDGSKYQNLLNRMHRAIFLASKQLNPKVTSSVLYSLVALKQTNAMRLFIRLCELSLNYVPKFTDEELVKVLVALTEYNYNDPLFTKALEIYVSEKVFKMSPEAVSQVMQYCSQKEILSKPIFNAVAEYFVYNSEHFTTHQIAQQIIPFGKLNYLPPDTSVFFRQLEKLLVSRFSQFHPQTLLNILHSCTLLQRFPVNFFAKIFSPHFIQQLQDQSGSIDPLVLGQLTQLYLTVILECPFYKGPKLHSKYRQNCFMAFGDLLETKLNTVLYYKVENGLIELLGSKKYFNFSVLSPYCYTLDIEICLDADGVVLSKENLKGSSKRIVLCLDDEKKFCANSRNLLGKEFMKQRHLRLLGYQVVQIPFYEIKNLNTAEEIIDYLHIKMFPHSFRMKW